MELNKRKLLILFISFICGASTTYAQKWNEIFKQKKTQREYLLQQIAALKVYANYLKKGYDVVNNGFQTVKDFSNGEFNLHNAFISGLKKVNPTIKKDVRVAEIIEMQIGIGKAFTGLRSDQNLGVSNQLYISNVRENLWKECLRDLEELLLVITSGKAEMSDDQRIKRLNTVYFSMRDKSAFTQSFVSEIGLFSCQKEAEKRLIEQTRNIYEIRK